MQLARHPLQPFPLCGATFNVASVIKAAARNIKRGAVAMGYATHTHTTREPIEMKRKEKRRGGSFGVG